MKTSRPKPALRAVLRAARTLSGLMVSMPSLSCLPVGLVRFAVALLPDLVLAHALEGGGGGLHVQLVVLRVAALDGEAREEHQARPGLHAAQELAQRLQVDLPDLEV